MCSSLEHAQGHVMCSSLEHAQGHAMCSSLEHAQGHVMCSSLEHAQGHAMCSSLEHSLQDKENDLFIHQFMCLMHQMREKRTSPLDASHVKVLGANAWNLYNTVVVVVVVVVVVIVVVCRLLCSE